MIQKLKSIYNQKKNDPVFLLRLSLSLLLCGILISLLAFFVKENSYSYNFRIVTGAFLFVFWFFSFPYFTDEVQDKIVSKIVLISITLIFLISAILYWLINISNNHTIFLLDLIFVLITLFVIYHLVSFVIVIFKSILSIVRKLFNSLSMDNENRLVAFLGKLTSGIIAISSLIIAISGLINALKIFVHK